MSRSVIIIGLTVGFIAVPQALQGEPPGVQPAGSVKGKIDPAVYATLEKSADGQVFVEVTLTPVSPDLSMRKKQRHMIMMDRIVELQDGILARLESSQFKLAYRPMMPPVTMIVGNASAAGLAKLASDTGVIAVRPCKVSSDVYTKLEKSEDGTAFVSIILRDGSGIRRKMNPGPGPLPGRESEKAQLKKVQDKVLGSMKPGEFTLAWRFETAAMMVGHINADGLAKLAKSPEIALIRPSKVSAPVFAEFKNNDDGMAAVLVSLKRVRDKRPPLLEKRESRVSQIKEWVRSVFEPGQFRITSYYSPSSFGGDVSPSGLVRLEAHPEVIGIGWANRPIRGTLMESVPFILANLVHVNLGFTGAGITVAVLDTGIDASNPDVQGDIAPGAHHFLRLIGGGTGAGAPDGNGHGTNLAAIITSPIGVAPDVQILPIKVLDDNIEGRLGDILDGIRYVVDHFNDYPNLAVMNLSIATNPVYPNCPCDNVDGDTMILRDVLNEAKAFGIVTFAGTGNNANCGNISAPACLSAVTPVTAVYDGNFGFVDWGVCDDPGSQAFLVTCNSNRWGCDSLAAPGVVITAGGQTRSGTSQATAHCSGLAALIQEKRGCESPFTPDQVVNVMFNTGTNTPFAFAICPLPPYPTSINAFAAVQAVVAPPTSSCAVAGDLNCDTFSDGSDFGLFTGCLSGPGGASGSGSCGCADAPGPARAIGDGDVDLADFAVFQQAFTGPPVGACCHIDGTCTEGTLQECSDGAGIYQGHATLCATANCPPPPFGACCDLDTGVCTILAEDVCNFSNGAYQGDGSDCATTACPVVRYNNTIDPLTTFITSPTGLIADDVTLDGVGGCFVRQYTVGLLGGLGGPFNVTVGLYSGFPPEAGLLIAGTEFSFFNLPDNGSPVFVSPIVDPPVFIPQSVWIKVDFQGNTSAGWFRAEQAELGFTDDFFGRSVPPWNLFWFGGPPNPWAGFWATITCDAAAVRSSGNESVVLTEPAAEPESRPGSKQVLMAPPGQELPEPIFGADLIRAATVRERLALESIGPPDEYQPLPDGRGSDQFSRSLPDGRGSDQGGSDQNNSDRSGSVARAGNVTLNLDSPSAGQSVLPGDPIQWSVTATVSSGDNAGLALVAVDLLQSAANPAMFDIPPATVVGVGLEGFDRPAGIANPGPGGAGSAYGGTQSGTPGAMNLVQVGGAQNTFGVTGGVVGTDVVVDSSIGQGAAQLVAQGSFLAPSTDGTYVFTLANGLANVLSVANPPPSPPEFWPVSGATVILGSASFSFTVGNITCTPSDMNNDGTVDGKDIQPFVSAFLIPGSASSLESCAVDVDVNGVLDNNDITAFIIVMVGVPSVTCTPGDLNDDGTIDGKDISLFIGVMLNTGGASAQQLCAADSDGNGLLNIQDVAPFVTSMLTM